MTSKELSDASPTAPLMVRNAQGRLIKPISFHLVGMGRKMQMVLSLPREGTPLWKREMLQDARIRLVLEDFNQWLHEMDANGNYDFWHEAGGHVERYYEQEGKSGKEGHSGE